MTNKILIKRSAVKGKVPTTTDLEVGELAINFPDSKIYTQEPGGTIIEVGAGLPTDLIGQLTNDGAGTLSWKPADWATIVGKPLVFPPALPMDAIGQLTNDGAGALTWTAEVTWPTLLNKPAVFPPTIGNTAVTAAAGDHTHAMHDLTDLPADSIGMLMNDGTGMFSWFPMPSSGMKFVGAVTPATLPAAAASNAGDFIVFSTGGVVGALTVKAGDMGVYDGGKWDIIENAQDLNAYLLKPAVDASGFLHRSGGGTLAWTKTPTATSLGVGTGTVGTTIASTPTGFTLTDIKSGLMRLGIDASGKITIGDLGGTGIRMVVASPSGDLQTQAIPTWSTLAGKPANLLSQAGGLVKDYLPVGASASSIKDSGIKYLAKVMTIPAGGKLGVGVTPTQACQVAGNIYCTGDVVAFYSDIRLKEITGSLDGALSKVNQLEGFTYIPNELAYKVGAVEPDDRVERVGLAAQDVQKVCPQAVKGAPFDEGEDGKSKSGQDYITVDYAKLVPLLVESIKELTAKVELLENK